MEGFCRASSPLSIADSTTRFNEKWPETGGFLAISPHRAAMHSTTQVAGAAT